MGAIGDLFYNLMFEDNQVTAEAKRAGTKAGNTAGSAMAQTLKTGVKTALTVGLTAGFGIMLKEGMELNKTLTEVQARSGAVGDEWDRMSDAIQRQNRRTTLSLEEIGDGVEAIHSDLGAVGEEVGIAADKLTDFGLVAQEAFGGAVRGADDLKDAYNLTFLEVFNVLDALVISHQRYGGAITANRDALIALAPALIAANLGWEDGLALINLANASGIDSAVMVTALTKALGKVKSPRELRELIADIQTTENDFQRAEKAIDLFGAKAGPKLALVLAPGKGALSDYIIGMDEAADATQKAADKIDSSWNRQIKLAIENVTGLLGSVGNTVGPVLSLAGALGGVASGVKDLGELFPKSGLLMKLGLTRGQSPATPMYVQDVTGGLPGAAGAGGKLGLVGGIAALSAGVAVSALAIMGLGELSNALSTPEQKAAFQENLRQQNLRKRRPASMGPLTSRHGNVTTGDELFGPPKPDENRAFGGDEWTSGWTRGVDVLHNDLIKAMEVIRTSNDPKAVGAAIAAVLKSILGGEGNAEQTAALVKELEAKRDAALARGDTKTAQAFANAIAKIEPLAKGRQWQQEQITEARKIVSSNKSTADKVAALKTIQADLLSHNRTMAAGIIGQQIKTVTAIVDLPVRLKNALGGILYGGGGRPSKDDTFTPPKPPKKPPAIHGGLPPDERAMGGPVTAGRPYWVGERQPELFVPRTSGSIVPASDLPGMAGGNTTINVPIQGLLKARDPFEVVTQLKRLGDFGVLTPRREPA